MSSAMEFAITTDLTPLKEFNISANFEECQAWLEENLAPYRGMVVTEEAIGAAKKYRANIRSVAGRIDECRKMAKAAALASYAPFEGKCKALTALCDESAANLDGQIKAFDERRRTEKLDAIRTFLMSASENLRNFSRGKRFWTSGGATPPIPRNRPTRTFWWRSASATAVLPPSAG